MLDSDMVIMLFLLAGIALEAAVYSAPPAWRQRQILIGLDLIILGFGSSALVFSDPNVFTGLFALASAYRVVNMLRIAQGRMHEQYLKRVTLRTSITLIIVQAITLLVLSIWPDTGVPTLQAVIIISFVQVASAIIILLSTIRSVIKMKYRPAHEHYADRDLPTVTVAIPARNETEELADCLRTVLANDYPKLEILVLDDCSQDKTPEIIREFAQDGVRFIRGTEPKDTWLAKNQAYARLMEAASGQFILFCGVDARLGNQTIRRLITMALSKNKQMVSVLPKRYGGGPSVSFIQPMRYWWELALPRRLFNRPPVLSTCWLISSNAIKQAGGFKAVSRSIFPEAYFARHLVKQDGYSFVRSDENLSIQTTKQLSQQRATAIRTRYPQLRRRPEQVFFLTLVEILVLVLPFILALAGFWLSLGIIHTLVIVTSVLLIITHCLIFTVTNPSNWWLALINFPVVALTDIIITHISMYKYEFSTIEWKGRNICTTVMHVIPKLPVIPN